MSSRSHRLLKQRFAVKACSNYYDYLWFTYHSKFYHALMTHGHKAKAFAFLGRIKESLKAREFIDVYYSFLVAMLQITPTVLILQQRLGSAVEGVPFPLNTSRKATFAVKWVVKLLKDKNSSLSVKALVDLLHNSLYQRGEAFERKKNFHRLALTNRFLIQRSFH